MVHYKRAVWDYIIRDSTFAMKPVLDLPIIKSPEEESPPRFCDSVNTIPGLLSPPLQRTDPENLCLLARSLKDKKSTTRNNSENENVTWHECE